MNLLGYRFGAALGACMSACLGAYVFNELEDPQSARGFIVLAGFFVITIFIMWVIIASDKWKEREVAVGSLFGALQLSASTSILLATALTPSELMLGMSFFWGGTIMAFLLFSIRNFVCVISIIHGRVQEHVEANELTEEQKSAIADKKKTLQEIEDRIRKDHDLAADLHEYLGELDKRAKD